ncbi:glycoside hydrolase family 13 protein [Polychaeton citri CBS 116435]|uniref:alpha-amylase n=1 Tax=Polychaeton citri CBS 116435 TaxID=1314669 RepID=A0A9P4USB3_9PEZI|nr:glycoside hydrolase family 13 protein [Polychaeton citri CBS 116435]
MLASSPRLGMKPYAVALLWLTLFLGVSRAATVEEWKQRSIYQVLTDRFAYPNDTTPEPCDVALGLYCGGSWKGIMENLDYIENMGFDAIWISPIVQQLPQQTADGEAYTAYWQQNLYELNDRFGTQQDLTDLIHEVHARGMLLMLDIVVNHMGYAGPGWWVDYSVLYPFNESKYYHEYCAATEEWNQTNLEYCWLGDWKVSLVDIASERQDVRDMFGEWIQEIVANYSIDGLRIDTAINVQPDFFPSFMEAAGVFATGEALNGDNSISCQWQEAIGSILNYPIYFPLMRAFTDPEGSIGDLVDTIETNKDNCQHVTTMGSFSENHDQPRFTEYTNDTAQAKNVITYTMMADGIPIIYQGQEQHMVGGVTPYMNRAPLWLAPGGYDTSAPLYTHIQTLNKLRHHVIQTSVNYTDYEAWSVWQDLHSFALRKGYDGSQVISVFNNNGESCADFTLAIPNHGYPSGVQLTEVLSCTDVTVNGTGYINLPMGQGEPKVLYPTHLLYGSSLCGLPVAPPIDIIGAPHTTVSTSYTTTINGQQTVIATATESPLPVTSQPGAYTASSVTSSPSSSHGASVNKAVPVRRLSIMSAIVGVLEWMV